MSPRAPPDCAEFLDRLSRRDLRKPTVATRWTRSPGDTITSPTLMEMCARPFEQINSRASPFGDQTRPCLSWRTRAMVRL